MNVSFTLESGGQSRPLQATIDTLIIAGWSGRDAHAIEEHIKELAELGIAPPSTVPLYYRVGHNQVTQEPTIQVVGDTSSGEAEAFVFQVDGELFMTVASDHTDRKLEAYSIALSKQICPKAIGSTAWRMADVVDHWDELMLRSWIEEGGQRVLYQEGPMASLRTPQDLISRFTGGQAILPRGTAMSCGTVSVRGGIRPSASFAMEIADPRTGRTLTHRYQVQVLPEIA